MRTCIKAWMSLNSGQIPPLTMELAALEHLKNQCHLVISIDIDPIFFKLAGNKDMHNIMNEFEFRPDRTTDYGVSCPLASKKYLKNRRHHFFSVAIDPILFKHAGNEDMHNILDEFKFQPELTTYYGVSCP